jgi:hypothetical protein
VIGRDAGYDIKWSVACDLCRRGWDTHVLQFGCELRRRLRRIVGDERVGHATRVPCLKRLNGFTDRLLTAIGDAIEIRDDSADYRVYASSAL